MSTVTGYPKQARAEGARVNTPLLQVTDLAMRFGGITAIEHLSLAVADRCITSIIGPNGAGKTTLFNCITGFYKPTAGSITMHHPQQGLLRLDRMPAHALASQAQVVRTFQNIRLFPRMTVLENLLVAQYNRLQQHSLWSIGGLLGLARYRQAEAQAIAAARQTLQRFDLLAVGDTAAGDLAYGVQRRVEIARAMCSRPRVLCLDEPAAGLNPKESGALNSLLQSLVAEECIAVLLIEHDMSVVMNISDHIHVLNYGQKIAEGTPQQIQNDPQVVAAYLGESEVHA